MNFEEGVLKSYSYPATSTIWNGILATDKKTWFSGTNISYTISFSEGVVSYTQQNYTTNLVWSDWESSSVITTSGATISSEGTFISGQNSDEDSHGTWYYATVTGQDGATYYLYTGYGSKKIKYINTKSSMPAHSSSNSVTWDASDTVRYGYWLNSGSSKRTAKYVSTPSGDPIPITGTDAYYDTYYQENSYCTVSKINGVSVNLGYSPNRVYFDIGSYGGVGNSSKQYQLLEDEYATFKFNGVTYYLYQNKIYSTKNTTTSTSTKTIYIGPKTTPNKDDRTFYLGCAKMSVGTSSTGSSEGRTNIVNSSSVNNCYLIFSTDGLLDIIAKQKNPEYPVSDRIIGIRNIATSSSLLGNGGMVFAGGYLIKNGCDLL